MLIISYILRIVNQKPLPSLFKISSDGLNSVGFTKQQAFPLGRQDYHSELDGGPIAIYCSDNNMVLLDRKKFEKMCEI